MVYYKPTKTEIDATGLAEIIINMIVRHYNLFTSNLSDQRSLLTSKL